MTDRAPLGVRATGVLALLLAAPVFAEVVQSYLGSTGALGTTVFVVVFLAPLYGGVALLIREAAVRRGLGWRGRLLLALAFGVLMPTNVDQSLYTSQTAEEVALWGDYLGSTLVAGVSLSAVLSWAVGHVVMSIAAPLALVEALLPAGRGRAWLGRVGLVVLAVLCVGIAWLIRLDDAEGEVLNTTAGRTVVPVLAAGVLAVLAFGRWGRPVPPVDSQRCPRPLLVGVAGFVLMVGFDFAPISWAGVVLSGSCVTAAAVGVARLSRSPAWGGRHVAALAYGAVLERTVVGFLAPLPPGADVGGKVVQNVLVLLLVLALGLVLRSRTAERAPVGAS